MTYMFKIESLTKEVIAIKCEWDSTRESYEIRRKLQETRFKALKERFCSEVLVVFEKQKRKDESDCFQLAERLIESFSNLTHKESIITRLKEEKTELSK
jgi:hypothetical protein